LSAIVIAERSAARPEHNDEQSTISELSRYKKLAAQCLLQNSATRLQPVLASFGLSL
jgi:hypothetical protein